ncbi:MAG TPA: hypothetical protein VKA73_08280 [Rubrobacter sp.]|nr:hypothetical protein [Rubrobacter sp.]
MTTAITNARVFDGERVLGDRTVVIEGPTIAAVGGAVPAGAAVVDARGATLMPGLIDAHVHTSLGSLALALRFGLTTELEMQGHWTAEDREAVATRDDVADVRSAGFAITPPGGHPSELFPEGARPGDDGEEHDDADPGDGVVMPFSSTPEEAVAFVPRLVASGSDYIKFMIDDGSIEGAPGLPMLDQATLDAGVAEAHRLGMLTVAHALTIETTRMAIQAGIDGVAHVFMDGPHTDEIVDLIATSGAFVVPCVVLDASMMGITGGRLAADPRVGAKLPPAWLATLRGSFDRYPQGRLDDVLGSVKALHDAGSTYWRAPTSPCPFPSSAVSRTGRA